MIPTQTLAGQLAQSGEDAFAGEESRFELVNGFPSLPEFI